MLANTNLDSEELDENVQNGINRLNQRFKEVERLINHLMGNQFDKAMDVTNGMDTVEKAKYYATLAFAIQSLYNVHLMLNNEEIRIESSNVELNRIKQSILKIKNVINFQQNNQNNENNNNDNKQDADVEMNGNSGGNQNVARMIDTSAASTFILNSRIRLIREFEINI